MACPRKRVRSGLIDLAYAHDLPLVATNDCYFPDRDSTRRMTRCCASPQGKAVEEPTAALTPEHYFHPAAEMRELFADLPEACDNTLVIARRCAFMPTAQAPILPPSRRRRG